LDLSAQGWIKMKKLPPNPAGQYLIGVDIGGTNVRAGLISRQGKVLADARRPAQAAAGFAVSVAMAIEAAQELLTKQKLSAKQICGLGLAVSGRMDSAKGVCLYSPNFAGPFPVPIAAPIEKTLGIAAYMLNDVNTATLGEHRFGAGKGYDQMVMITLGTGIGGGAVIDGKLRIGYTEGFAEVGHMILDAEGPQCGCGNHGCWEALAARDPIIKRAVFGLQTGAPSILFKLAKKDLKAITPALITQAASQGDELSLQVLEETAYWVGIGCVNLIQLYNPQVLVIGGGIAGALPYMRPAIQRIIDSRAQMVPGKTCKITPSTLGDDAGIIGGAVLVLEALSA
jgi:glucokinase